MAMTSAERQKKFRENQRKKGLWKRDEWRDADRLFAPKHPNGSFVTMTSKELLQLRSHDQCRQRQGRDCGMKHEIIPFKFDDKYLRHIVRNDRHWFAAKDVLAALEYPVSAKPEAMIRHVPDEWKGAEPFSTPSGTQKLLCLSEEGLYFFAARSDKQYRAKLLTVTGNA